MRTVITAEAENDNNNSNTNNKYGYCSYLPIRFPPRETNTQIGAQRKGDWGVLTYTCEKGMSLLFHHFFRGLLHHPLLEFLSREHTKTLREHKHWASIVYIVPSKKRKKNGTCHPLRINIIEDKRRRWKKKYDVMERVRDSIKTFLTSTENEHKMRKTFS